MAKTIILRILLVAFVVFALEFILRIWGVLYLRTLYSTYTSSENLDSKSQTILCLGESTTSGLWVNSDSSYPAQLERVLRKYYNSDNIHVIVPPHLGQNTSQMADRMAGYIALYNPKVIVMMVGSNNHWSLAESHISRFLSSNSINAARMKLFIFLNDSRLFKVMRYLYLSIKLEGMRVIEGLTFKEYIAGAPQRMNAEPPRWVLNTFDHNIDHFNDLWHYDVTSMVHTAKGFNIPVILMTYPIPISVPTYEFTTIAKNEHLILIRNDLDFENIKKSGTISEYIFSRDNWHPTEKGYTIVANNVFGAIVNNALFSRSSVQLNGGMR